MSAPVLHVDRYELIERLGHGHTCEVHLARTVRRDGEVALVALRRPLPAYAADPRFVEEFLASARRAEQLLHPGIARVLDVSTSPRQPFAATEYVHGEQLAALLRRLSAGQRPLDLLLRVIALAAEAVEHAHAGTTPLVHASLTPQNVFVAYDGEVRVSDFGTPRAAARDDDDAQRDHGGLAYTSPEQAAERLPTPASDVFALGILLWECITQQRLFVAPSRAETRALVRRCEIPRPGDRTDCPAALERVVMRCLAKDPHERPATAGVLADELEDILRKRRRDTSSAALRRLVHELFTQREAGRDATVRRALHPSRESYAPLAASSPSLTPPAPELSRREPTGREGPTSTAKASEDVRSRERPDESAVLAAESAVLAAESAVLAGSASTAKESSAPEPASNEPASASSASKEASSSKEGASTESVSTESVSKEAPPVARTSAAPRPRAVPVVASPSPVPSANPRRELPRTLVLLGVGGVVIAGLVWLATRGDDPASQSTPTSIVGATPDTSREGTSRAGEPSRAPRRDEGSEPLEAARGEALPEPVRVETPPEPVRVETTLAAAQDEDAPNAQDSQGIAAIGAEAAVPIVEGATLEIVCRPAAEIFLDNRSLGLTPRIVEIPSGAVAIGLRSTGPEHTWRTLRTTLAPHGSWTIPMSECP